MLNFFLFFFSSRRRHTRYIGDWSSDVCSSDLAVIGAAIRSERGVSLNPPLAGRVSAVILTEPALSGSAAAQGVRRAALRSEERRVGKECRARWAADA